MNRRSNVEERNDTDLPSNVVPFRQAAAWVPIGEIIAAVVMRCRDNVTVIEAQSPGWEEEETPGDCF